MNAFSSKFLIKNFNLFSFLLILIVGLVVYANSFDGEFVFDDGVHIAQQRNIQELSRFTEWSTWTKVNDRPLAVYSLALNYHWNKLNVVGFHVFNTLIHILSSFFVFLICRLIFNRVSSISHDKRKLAYLALFCALVFLVHPIQTQAVSYIIQRMTSMSALFYLASVFFYIKARNSYFEGGYCLRSLIFLLLVGISSIAAVLSKQSAVSLPLAFILVEYFFVRNKLGLINKRFIISALLIFSSIIVIYVFVWGLPKETLDISVGSYFVTQFRVLLKYLLLLVLPIGQNVDYNFSISNSLFGVEELFSLGLLLSILYFAFKLRHKLPLFSFGIFWIFVSLSVESSIIPITDVIFEHRLYLATFGFSLVLVAVYLKYSDKIKLKYFRILAISLILIYSTLTYARNKVWQNQLSLWSDVVKKSPDKSRPNLNLGIAYFHNSQALLAMKHFDKAIELKPDGWLAYFNRAETYLLQGNLRKANVDFDKCIQLKDDFPMAYDSRGVVKTQFKEYESALVDFNKAIELQSNLATAWLNRANAKIYLKLFDDALVDYNQAILLKADFKQAFNNRGLLYLYNKEFELAYRDLTRAVEIDPKFLDAYNNLAKVFMAMKEYKMAIDYLDKSIAVNEQYSMTFKLRGSCYVELKEYKLALNDLMKARKLGEQIEDSTIELLTKRVNEEK